nr:rod shape-determining protein MreD [Pontibaca salina]
MIRLGYCALALVIIFFHLLPLDTLPRHWAPPDLLLAFTLAWSLRRPEYVPALSIAAVMLMADLLFQRPPGLLALLVVLGSEHLKSRASNLGEMGFVLEWATVGVVIVAITFANRLVLGILTVQQAPLTLSLIQLVMTVVTYPLIVVVTQVILRVRRPMPRDGRTSRVRP